MRARVIAVAAVGAVLAGVLVLAAGSRDGGGTLRAAFGNAVQVVPGNDVRIAGRKIGSIASVDEVDGQALLELEVDDDAWPLRRGTTARLRWGSTTGYALRYVELQPGPQSAPALPDRGLLRRADTVSAVELDEMYRIFRGRTREDFGAVIDELSATFGGRARPLARALRDAPAGLDQTAEVLRELGADPAALETLAVAGDRTVGALAARRPQLQGAVDHAAATFDELAGHTTAQRRALERLPSTLQTGRATLARLDGSLGGLEALVADLRPGAAGLRRLAPVARAAIGELRSVAPLATTTLRSGTAASPGLRRLLRVATPFLPRLGAVLSAADPMIGCLRPYGPEVAGLLSGWTGFIKNYDAEGHYVRAFAQQPPIPVGTPLTAAQTVRLLPGLSYAMPRPPGLNAGKPWFQPQCGAGPESLDASKDPEAAGARR